MNKSKKNKVTKLQSAYERKFNELYGDRKIDHDLRDEVFRSISQIENFARIAGLFTGLFAKTQFDLISGTKGSEIP